MDQRLHWEQVYQIRDDPELSWYQTRPLKSLGLIEGVRPLPRRVIDVGGGQSALAGELLSRGVDAITVLDISAAAIDRGRKRLGDLAQRVRWVQKDVLEEPDLGQFDLWHDRAVFHFFTQAADRRRYVAAAERSVIDGGHVVVATFSLTGPEKCSGLQVCRYDPESLAAEFGRGFEFVRSAIESHATPWGKLQDFVYVMLKRVDVSGDRGTTVRR